MDRAFFDDLGELARAAIALELERGISADDKGGDKGFDPVTEADRAAERALRKAIAARFPDHGIWGEEYGMEREQARFRWSLDPVDGTRALVCGLPSWAVLVALIDNGRHIAGMIDLPELDERLVGIGGETRLNDVAVTTSGCAALAEARLSSTDPHLFQPAERAAFDRVRDRVRLTRYGLDAMAYARVATGDLDLVIENSLQPHDYDALIPVVRGAGGHVGDWRGGNDFAEGRIVAAASEALYREAVHLLDAR